MQEVLSSKIVWPIVPDKISEIDISMPEFGIESCSVCRAVAQKWRILLCRTGLIWPAASELRKNVSMNTASSDIGQGSSAGRAAGTLKEGVEELSQQTSVINDTRNV